MARKIFSAEGTELQIGDRVVLNVNNPAGNDELHVGMTGTVCNLYNQGWNTDSYVGIRWDIETDVSHDCDGTCESEYGYNVPSSCVSVNVCERELSEEAVSALPDILSLL